MWVELRRRGGPDRTQIPAPIRPRRRESCGRESTAPPAPPPVPRRRRSLSPPRCPFLATSAAVCRAMRSASARAWLHDSSRKAAISDWMPARRRSTSVARSSDCLRSSPASTMSFRILVERAAKNGPPFLPARYPNPAARIRKLAHSQALRLPSPPAPDDSAGFCPACARTAGTAPKPRSRTRRPRRLMRRSAGEWSRRSGWPAHPHRRPARPWPFPRRLPAGSEPPAPARRRADAPPPHRPRVSAASP